MLDPSLKPAIELAEMLRSKQISARELLDLYLGRIERYNPALNAVVTLDEERAHDEAKHADDDTARGNWHGGLHGLPMTVKDSIETAGMRTTSGAPMLANHIPERDADAVARLRSAGAVVFGKTNLPIFAGDMQSYNELFGTTNNPWDLSRSPGGSSGGAAVAVAAGLTTFELGSDIGGSIRTPAHYCGVYGHKPTWGIVPARGHIPGMPGDLAPTDIGVLGPLARSAEDLALALDVLTSPDDANAVAWSIKLPPARHTSLRDYHVAAWLDDEAAPVDAPVRQRLDDAVRAIRAAGATVDERARPPFTMMDAVTIWDQLTNPIMAGGMPDEEFVALAAAADALPPEDTASHARWMRNVTQRYRTWSATNERRARMRAQWGEFFRDYDVLVCPAAPTTAFPHDHNPDMDARMLSVNRELRPLFEGIRWASFVGVCHLPATVTPIGLASDGLPVGLQVVGPYLEDRTTIEFARLLGDVVGGFKRPPAFATEPISMGGAQR